MTDTDPKTQARRKGWHALRAAVGDAVLDRTVTRAASAAVVGAVWDLAVAEGRRQANNAITWNTSCVGCAQRLDERRAGHEEGYDLALRDHGLMAGDEPVELRSEFEVRWHATDSDDGISMDRSHLGSVEEANRVGPTMVGQYGIIRWTVWQRSHRLYADGSSWTGPWGKVEQDA